MRTILTALIAGLTGLLALGVTAAYAEHNRDYQRSYRPDRCTIDHDHRSHAANYYDYYAKDRYYRAGAYRNSGVKFSIRIGDDGYNDNYRRNRHRRDDYRRRDDRRDHHRGRNNGYRGRIVNREVYDTRYRAQIILTEELVRGRRGHARLVCTVKVRGPEAHHVSERRMYRIANRDCSPRARVRVVA